jgi:hypothetical protein
LRVRRVRADKDIHDALNAFAEFTQRYQGAFDEPAPLFRRRADVATPDVATPDVATPDAKVSA